MKNREWVAFSTILGVLAGLVLTNTGADDREAMLFWLVYCVTCGVIINTQEGLGAGRLALGSWPSPLIMILTILYRLYFKGSSVLSGIPFEGALPDFLRLTIIFVGSVIAVWIFAHARPVVLFLLKRLFGMRKGKADQVERNLNWLARVIGAVLLIGQLILG